MNEEALAEVLALALSGRPDRLQALVLEGQPAAVKDEVRAMVEALSKLPLALDAAAPSAELRARILASLAKPRAARRALLVVDMINDHLTPGSILEVPRARNIVTALAARIEAARADKTPIVYVLDAHDPDDSDMEEWGVHAVEGSHGAEVWPALAPKEGDVIVKKPAYSGFFASDLEPKLAALGVDTLELTGCSTEIQLLATATDALQKGYAVEVPADLQAGMSGEAEQLALTTLRFLRPYKPSRDALLARIEAPR